MALLVFYLALALSVSFLCSILEAVLLSVPSTYLSMREKEGSKNISLLKSYKQDIDKPLSAILSLNTIAHTIGAAGVGAQAAKVFGDAYFGAVSVVLTILILVVSEIIPKTIGATYWRTLVSYSAPIIKCFIFVTYPLVWLSEFITKLIAPKHKEQKVSREEVSAMVTVGVEEGIFHIKENKIIQNLIRLEGVKSKDVMTPRVVVAIASEDMTLQEFYDNKSLLHHSRIPVYSPDDKDNITSYVLRQNVFQHLVDDNFDIKLKDIAREIIVSHENRAITALWEDMLSGKEHIALIIDEYGSFEGIVTMEDIIESILGLEILDEKDDIEDMQQYARERWANRKEKYKHL
ncbi:MAG: CNNM domain-containing protein [Rikenellaceae bacterium]